MTQVVDALPPDHADQSVPQVLPWRTGRDRLVVNAHGAQAAGDNCTAKSIKESQINKSHINPSLCAGWQIEDRAI